MHTSIPDAMRHCSRRQLEVFSAREHRPRHARVLSRVVAIADHRQHGGGRGRTHARQTHELLGALILARDGLDVPVVLRDAFIEPV